MNATVIGQPGYYAGQRRLPSKLTMLVGDRLTRARLRFIAIAVIIVGSLLLTVSFATTKQNRTANGLGLGSDYLAFYDAGVLLNQHPASQLYNLDLQARLYHTNLPGESDGVMLPFANAPFIALLMRPLAHFNYAASYGLWVAISLTLYVLGFAWVWRASGLNKRGWGFGLLMAMSFEPFVIECLHGGQISAIGFASICGALALCLRNRPFAGGLMLAICLYKPTLLPIILPMLLITGQRRALLGFATGALALAAICLVAVGPTACVAYAQLLCGYASKTTIVNGGFQTWKFIDANSFMKLLGAPAWLIAIGVAGLATLLIREMMTLARAAATQGAIASAQSHQQSLFWAIALTATLVVNVYVGVYDAILIVPAVVLTCGALLRRDTDTGRNLPLRWRCMLLTLWVTPWVSGLIARDLGLQALTPVLFAVGMYQLQLLRARCSTKASPARVPTDRRGRVANKIVATGALKMN